MKLPRYTSKDYEVLLWIMMPFAMVINTLIFGRMYYSSWPIFLIATFITGIGCAIDFILCGYVAVAMKARFPSEKQLTRRLTFMILIFLTLTGLFLYSLFQGYESIGFYGYRFNETGFIWSYIAMGILNIFLTFLHEGISRYEEWKANLKETERVRLSYKQSQLQGLKSQINPHFLFNSLNSLSSLINEDEEAAEEFLDEMSKIYRYMLRNEDDQLVLLRTELSFIKSYFYLLNTRYSNALQLRIDVSEEDKMKWIPPLTLQVITENATVQNAFSKSSPLTITISVKDDELLVTNTLRPKIGSEKLETEAGLDNLVEKYRLLHQAPIQIMEDEDERTIRVPLIKRKEGVVA
jgi:two-component system LytT family sensor kinase